MKPKNLLLCLSLLFATTMNAQTILKGDMNDDKDVNIADVTSLVDVVLGKAPKETISVGSPYMVDNSYVVGTWYAPDGTSFTLNEDGTTDYPNAATYKFRPYQGSLMMFTASGAPIKTFVLNEVESTYLLAIDYATGAYTYYTNSGSLATGITLSQTSLTMNSGTTAQLTATLSPEGAVGSVTWTSSDESVATVDANGVVTAVAGGSCSITATAAYGVVITATCEVNVLQAATKIELSSTSLVLALNSYQKIIATVLPSTASNTKVSWSSSDDSVAEVTGNGSVVAVGLGECIVTCTAEDGSGVAANCSIKVIGADEQVFVDLGLPSGTLWAACNIGADNPEDYGDYFAWGETIGYNDGKTDFSWDTYIWCNGSATALTKYCTDSSFGYEGFTDNKTELDIEDDAAYVNWGAEWRIPSLGQFEELINSSYTTTEGTMQNGVKGYRITSKTTGNSIFLPAAGFRVSDGISSEGRSGCYCVGSPLYYSVYGESFPNSVFEMWFTDSETINPTRGERRIGRSVRPVRLLE